MTEILLVAPIPTHPSTTGASARIRYMAEALRSLGHQPHFLHLQQPLRVDHRALREYWGDRLHAFRGLSPLSCAGRGRRKLLRVAAKTLHLNLPVDSYYDPAAAPLLRDVLGAGRFGAVIVSYVFYSRLLDSVAGPTLKLIDTHDVFADRYSLYREHGQAGEFFSTSRAGEGKALDRADRVIAIQESDARHFRELSRTPVTVVGHLAPVPRLVRPDVHAAVEEHRVERHDLGVEGAGERDRSGRLAAPGRADQHAEGLHGRSVRYPCALRDPGRVVRPRARGARGRGRGRARGAAA